MSNKVNKSNLKPLPPPPPIGPPAPKGYHENVSAHEASLQIQYNRYVQSAVANGNENYLSYEEWKKHKVAQ
jgi:hypothetical protein